MNVNPHAIGIIRIAQTLLEVTCVLVRAVMGWMKIKQAVLVCFCLHLNTFLLWIWNRLLNVSEQKPQFLWLLFNYYNYHFLLVESKLMVRKERQVFWWYYSKIRIFQGFVQMSFSAANSLSKLRYFGFLYGFKIMVYYNYITN